MTTTTTSPIANTVTTTNGTTITNADGSFNVPVLVNQLMQVENQPLNKVKDQLTQQDSVISALGTFQSKVSAFETAIQNLQSPTSYGGKTTTSSDPNVISATATNSASPANILVSIAQSAQFGRVSVDGFTSSTDTVDPSQISLNVGNQTYTASSTSTSPLPANPTVSDVANWINGLGANVNASVIQTSTGNWSLVLTGTQTGASNGVSVSGLSTATAASNGASENLTTNILQSARDSIVFVDGLRIQQSSNTITGVVPGVNFTIQQPFNLPNGATESSVTASQSYLTQIAVTQNSTNAQSIVQSVVTTYNDLLSTYNSLTQSSTDATTRGVLNTDFTVQSLMSSAQNMMLAGLQVSGQSSNTSLASIGVEFQSDGTLQFNATSYNSAVSNGLIAKLASGVTIGASGQNLDTYLSNAVQTGGLIYNDVTSAKQLKTDLLQQQVDLQDRLNGIQQRYTNRFSALNAQLASLKTISDSLTQVINGLNNKSG